MKLFPAAAILACTAILISCGRKAAENAEIEKQVQERLAEEHQAEQQRELHEREAALDERERLLEEREQQLTIAATPAPPQAPVSPPSPAAHPRNVPASPDASYQAFYDVLAPYGSWIEMNGYGYVWQPRAMVENALWRPYTLGHWAFTDDGWTWISDEPFGWITYHYGRWMRTRRLNWVWFPGNQWAPAWVSWRYGNDFVGWAPLPPEARFDGAAGIQQWADEQYGLGASDYTFVPASEFGDDNMADVAVPPDQTEPIYDESNNVTDLYYDSGAYAIICYGPNYEFMRSKCRHPLPPPLRLRRTGYLAQGNNNAVLSGTTLQVTAPRILQGPAAPSTVIGRIADTRIVSPATPPPPPGAAIPPLYHPPQTATGAAPGGMRIPSAMNPEPVAQGNPANGNPGDQSGSQPGSSGAATGMRIPSQLKPVPVSPEVEAQKARDLQAIRDRQAAEREQKEAARDERAAQEQSDRAAREQAVHQMQPSSVPAGTQASGQGRVQ